MSPETTVTPASKRLERMLRIACWCGLFGVLLTVLPMLGITPMRLALSLAIGQPLCVLGLILFVVAVVLDLRRKRVL